MNNFFFSNFLKDFCGKYTRYISNAFITKTRLKLAKNQANPRQHPKAQLLFSENYSHSSSPSSKNNYTYSKSKKTKEQVCLYSSHCTINHNENENENENWNT